MTRVYEVEYGKDARLGRGWYATMHSDFSTEPLGKVAKTKKKAVKDMKQLARKFSRRDRAGLVKVKVYYKDGSLDKQYDYVDGVKQ